jgi:hypothetical protein
MKTTIEIKSVFGRLIFKFEKENNNGISAFITKQEAINY